MEIQRQYNPYNFKAHPGKRMLEQVSKEFNGNAEKVEKFKTLFNRTHEYLDENIVIDINKNNDYIISHADFEGFENTITHISDITKPLAETVITECTRTFGYGQLTLFRNIVRTLTERGIPFKEIERIGSDRIKNEYASNSFIESVKAAKWIKENCPDAEWSNEDFEFAQEMLAQKEIDTYIHSIT